MDNLKMILNDGTEVSITGFGLPMNCVALCADRDEMNALWTKLSPANLINMQILQSDGTVFASYTNVSLDGVQCIINADSTLTVHFYMTGTTINQNAADAEYAEAARILLGEVE